MNMTEFWYAFDQGERNFQEVTITDIIFDAIELDGVSFTGANLSDAKIRKSVFRNCIFTEASFKSADFTRSSFIHSHLQATNFTELIAVELVFDQCDMSSSKFINAEMGDVFFNDCDLSQTHWQDSWWCGGLEECNLIQANMSNISASCNEIIDSIYPNGEKGSGSWQNLIIQSDIPTPDSSRKMVRVQGVSGSEKVECHQSGRRRQIQSKTPKHFSLED